MGLGRHRRRGGGGGTGGSVISVTVTNGGVNYAANPTVLAEGAA